MGARCAVCCVLMQMWLSFFLRYLNVFVDLLAGEETDDRDDDDGGGGAHMDDSGDGEDRGGGGGKSRGAKIVVRKDEKTGAVVLENAVLRHAADAEELGRLFDHSESRRTTASTRMNRCDTQLAIL